MRRIFSAALISLIFSTGSRAQIPENFEPIVHTNPIRTAVATPASTSLALALAARDLPAAKRVQVTQAALSIILLAKFNRILPPSITTQDLDRLSRIFITTSANENEQASAAQSLPTADTLTFDGSKLSGGNFRYIDAIIGMDGHPIAFDRQLPAWIIPLTSSAAQGLSRSQQIFANQPTNVELAELTNRIYQVNVSLNLAADGIFLRPYAGRIDDLYYHLAQSPDSKNSLNYFALLDSLPPRQYSPISGTKSPQDVPPSRVNLSDILSTGSFAAIQRFRKENPQANIRNPFKGLAVRMLPLLDEAIHKAKQGKEWEISREIMRRAMNDTRRFTPQKVPPIFNDPSRFLGWVDPRYIRVSKKKNQKSPLIEEIQKIDFETPLPEMTFDPTGNELLQTSEHSGNPRALTEEEANAALLQDLGMPPQSPSPAKNSPPPLTLEDDSLFPYLIPEETIASTAPTSSANPHKAASKEPPTLLTTNPASAIAADTPPPSNPTPTPQPTPIDFTPEVATSNVVPLPSPPSIHTNQAPSQTPSKPALAISQSTPTSPDSTNLPLSITAPLSPAQPSKVDFITEMPTDRVPERRTAAYQVAVLAPTAREAMDYLKKIAASDLALSENLAESKRSDCLIRWLGNLVQPFDSPPSNSTSSPNSEKFEPLVREARDEIVGLLKRREALQSTLIIELQNRSKSRKALEIEIQTIRRDQLAKRTGLGA